MMSFMETLNCNIWSLEHDTEMVDHSMNHKLEIIFLSKVIPL